MQGGMPGMAQGTPNAFPPQAGGPGGAGPNKTVLLQPSEGVVSVARTAGGAVAAAPPGTMVVQGASTLYWIVCLVIGIGVGVAAYFIYLQVA
jgi:hypothetical protein